MWDGRIGVEAMKPGQKAAFIRLAVERYEKASMMPPGVRKTVAALAGQQRVSEAQRLLAIYKEYSEAANQLALSNNPVNDAVRSKLRTARQEMAAAMERHVAIWDERIRREFIPPSGGPQEIRAVLTILGSRPPPHPSDTGTAAPLVPGSGPPSSGGTLLLSDAELERRVAAAGRSVSSLRTQSRSVVFSPVVVPTAPGRYAVNEAALWEGRSGFSKMTFNAEAPRMPREWKGMLDAQGKPYNYGDVVRLSCWPKCIGGGIHLGAVAAGSPDTDWKKFILSYDVATQELKLTDLVGRQFRYGPIAPEALKALYRFAAAGRNGAVTIGWGGDARDYSAFRQESRIMPDPYLADTEVGQDLVVADSLPWKLDREFLPGGIENPIAKEFRAAYEQRRGATNRKLRAFAVTAKPLTKEYGGELAERLPSNTYFDLMTKAALMTNTPAEAAEALLLIVKYLREPPGGRRPMFLDEEQRAKDHRMADSLREFKGRDQLLHYLVEMGLRLPPPGDAESKGNAFFARDSYLKIGAGLLAQNSKLAKTDLARLLSAFLPTVTVAVLMDGDGKVRIEGDRLILETKLTYKYLASREKEVEGGLRIDSGPDGVEEWKELSDLANQNLVVLEKVPAVARIAEYSRVLALLRWATKRNALLAVDLSALADVAASDRSRTPTPDALIR